MSVKAKSQTAAEFIAELEKDPVFRAQRQARKEAHRRKEEELAQAEVPLVEALSEIGIRVVSVWDLVNRPVRHYPDAVPILLSHLQRPYPDAIRDGIARALAVPEAKFAWSSLVRLYRTEVGKRTRDGLAVAISNVADDETIDELIALARDPQNGDSRVLLLSALERSRLPHAREALIELGRDPVLEKEAWIILRRLKRKK